MCVLVFELVLYGVMVNVVVLGVVVMLMYVFEIYVVFGSLYFLGCIVNIVEVSDVVFYLVKVEFVFGIVLLVDGGFSVGC